ncbi:MAG: hypothetical protein AAGN82_22315, partial [Myxococcota bacterium]
MMRPDEDPFRHDRLVAATWQRVCRATRALAQGRAADDPFARSRSAGSRSAGITTEATAAAGDPLAAALARWTGHLERTRRGWPHAVAVARAWRDAD